MTAYNTQNEQARGGLFAQLTFMFKEKLAEINTLKVCQITAVNADGTVNVKPMVLKLDGNNQPIEPSEWKNFSVLQTQGGSGGFVIKYSIGDIVLVGFCDRDPQAVRRTRKQAAPSTYLHFPLSSGIVLGAVYFNAPTVYVKATDKVYAVGDLDVSKDTNIQGDLSVGGDVAITGNNEAATYSVAGTPGATFTFVDANSVTHSVVNGIIVS